MSDDDNQSMRSSILSKESENHIQTYQTVLVMNPVTGVALGTILPEFVYLVACSFVSFIIYHYLAYFVSEAGIVIFSVAPVCINLMSVLISDSIIEAGSRYMNKSMELKQYNASRVYFAYTVLIGFAVSLVVSVGVLLTLKAELTMLLIDTYITDKQSWVYTWLVLAFAVFYFLAATRKILRVEGLTTQNLVMGFSFLAQQLYFITLQITITQMLGKEVSLFSFLLTFVGPLAINGVVQFCNVFHVKEKKINYKSIHAVQKLLLKPFRPKVMFDILKNACYYIILNAGDALIYFLTFEAIIQQEEYVAVSFSILFVELSNCLNKAVGNTMDTPFRINMQLKRYDRVQQFFTTAYMMLGINFGFQIVVFALRNKIYRLVFSNAFDSSLQLYHCALDGVFGTFSAYTTAVIRSDQKHRMGTVVGLVKIALAFGAWYIGAQLNTQKARYSVMIYYYRYSADILGFGFFLLILQKFNKLRRQNYDETQFPQATHEAQFDYRAPIQVARPVQTSQPPKLVLKPMQPIEIQSRVNASMEITGDTQSREDTQSRDVARSSKQNVIFSTTISDENSNRLGSVSASHKNSVSVSASQFLNVDKYLYKPVSQQSDSNINKQFNYGFNSTGLYTFQSQNTKIENRQVEQTQIKEEPAEIKVQQTEQIIVKEEKIKEVEAQNKNEQAEIKGETEELKAEKLIQIKEDDIEQIKEQVEEAEIKVEQTEQNKEEQAEIQEEVEQIKVEQVEIKEEIIELKQEDEQINVEEQNKEEQVVNKNEQTEIKLESEIKEVQSEQLEEGQLKEEQAEIQVEQEQIKLQTQVKEQVEQINVELTEQIKEEIEVENKVEQEQTKEEQANNQNEGEIQEVEDEIKEEVEEIDQIKEDAELLQEEQIKEDEQINGEEQLEKQYYINNEPGEGSELIDENYGEQNNELSEENAEEYSEECYEEWTDQDFDEDEVEQKHSEQNKQQVIEQDFDEEEQQIVEYNEKEVEQDFDESEQKEEIQQQIEQAGNNEEQEFEEKQNKEEKVEQNEQVEQKHDKNQLQSEENNEDEQDFDESSHKEEFKPQYLEDVKEDSPEVQQKKEEQDVNNNEQVKQQKEVEQDFDEENKIENIAQVEQHNEQAEQNQEPGRPAARIQFKRMR
ncbi:MatE_and transmembrane domain-containing protein [Hexamita inflata]|uniref:MatE and transmembrane domain-containing protein n=1 Tax=Hexamita inflata TaxID=28002 RepID=A0AA86QR07_9EUKA|nr:MatE and transmembrane domain-containing protein [Hexamita inflata]